MEKISVAIRVRPLSKQEDAKASPWKLGPNTITFSQASSPQAFTFDQVFSPDIPTSEIYQESAKHLITSAVQGFNGTIFAYGQTSSGKTYTMRGSPQDPGIIPQALRDVFLLIDHAREREFLIRVSYLEIYNEEINDLLAPENQKLQVHENLERGIFVAGLREEIVSTPDQVLELLAFGEAHRRVGETNMNVYSSRSHTIFRMVIESRDVQDSTSSEACDAVRVSVLNLVDLAGSERVSKTGAEGARLKEGTHINKSLMTLGNVINKLSEGIHKQGGHVPYRDSKLTRILQPALGGNAKTTIICNVTPALMHADETKGTLLFASRANRVTNCAQVNEVMTDAALLKRQKKEIEDLRSKLQESNSDHLEDEILSLRNKLLKFELEKERLSLELLEEKKVQAECERRIKEQEQKIEKLGTMVINSAIDDRDYAKKGSRRERRETWCPRVPSSNPIIKTHDVKRPLQKASSDEDFIHSKKRMHPMPPPFEMLLEQDEECIIWDSQEFDEVSDFKEPSLTPVRERFLLDPGARSVQKKRRSLPTTIDEAEVQQEIVHLRLEYEALLSERDTNMREIMLENSNLKEKLANGHAQPLINKNGLIGQNPTLPLQGRRCKCMDEDAYESGAIIKNLQAQVDRLETEKFYMQRELDRLMEQAKGQTTTAQEDLRELYQELEETTEQLNTVVEQNKKLQDEICKLKLPAMSEQLTDNVKLDGVKSGSVGDEIKCSILQKRDVECQTLSSISEDKANMKATELDEECLYHTCSHIEAEPVCKELSEHLQAFNVTTSPLQRVNTPEESVNGVTCINDLPAEILRTRVCQEGSFGLDPDVCGIKPVQCAEPGEANLHLDHDISKVEPPKASTEVEAANSLALVFVPTSCDSSSLLESCPVQSSGLPGLESADQQLNQLSQGSLDVLVELEALRLNNKTLSSELEEVTRKLDLANVDSCMYEYIHRDIEQILLETKEKCAVHCATIQGLEQQKAYHESQSSQFRSDVVALRKELASLKLAPPLVEKERDALRKELDIQKTKAKEIQAKLKSALQDKSKLEAEKANVERELKHLRGSTMLLRDINRRDSIADKRRESMAPALSKTKQQLSTLEHALQMRSTELERAAFDIQVLQESCSKLEFSVTESENLGSTLKEQLTSVETIVENLRLESKVKDENVERLAIELEAASEQWKASIVENETLQQQSGALASKVQELEVSSQLQAAHLMKEKEDLAQQLTDAYIEFEEEKAAWTASLKDHCVRVSADAHAQITLLESRVHSFANDLEKILRTQKEFITVSNVVDNELQKLHLTVQDECSSLVLLQTDEIELVSSRIDGMKTRYTAFEEEIAQVKSDLTAVCEARVTESNQMRQLSSALQQYMEDISGLEMRCTTIAAEACDKFDKITGKHMGTINFLSQKLLEAEKLTDQLAESLERLQLEVGEMPKKAMQDTECQIVRQMALDESTTESTKEATSSLILSHDNREQTESAKQGFKTGRSVAIATVEVDVGTENILLKEENRHLSTANMKLQMGIQFTKEREEVYRGRLQEAIWMDRQLNRSESAMSQCSEGQSSPGYRKLQEDIAASRLEVVELKVELENARAQCATLLENPVLNLEKETTLLEVEHENYSLQHRLQIAEERAKTRRDIIRNLREEAKTRESGPEQAAMKNLVFQKGKLQEQVRELTTELQFLHNQVTHLQCSHQQGNSNYRAVSPVSIIKANLQTTDELGREGLKLVPNHSASYSSGRLPLTPIDQNRMHDDRSWGSQNTANLRAPHARRMEFK